jgi:hypothetical protein
MEPYEPSQPDEHSGSDMITMNPPRRPRRRLGRPVAIAGVAVVALAGGGGIGYAATHSLTAKAADTAALAASSPSATPSPSASGKPGHGWRSFPGGPGRVFGPLGLGPIGGGVLHGQLTVPKSGGGYQVVDVQNGTVTAVSTGSVTVKSADGFTATYTVTSKTVVTAEAPGIASVKKGDTVFVTATVSGSTATAASVVDLTAVKAGRASFGFPGGATKMMPVPAQPPSS